MYLEISKRQSGKTERLLRTVKAHIDADLITHTPSKVLVVSHQHYARDDIKYRAMSMNVQFNGECDVITFDEIVIGGFRKLNRDYIYYFDEFDFYPIDKFLQILTYINVSESYFVTSPERLRHINYITDMSDPMMYLLNIISYDYYSAEEFVRPISFDKMNLTENRLLMERDGIFLTI